MEFPTSSSEHACEEVIHKIAEAITQMSGYSVLIVTTLQEVALGECGVRSPSSASARFRFLAPSRT